jgi:hypothetical protein
MKKYTKTHTNPKAATAHSRKIAKRGGKFQITRKAGKIKVESWYK